MANMRKNFTMQGVGYPVSAAGRGEKAGPQASSSNDRSFLEVDHLASTEYRATRNDEPMTLHVHDDPNKPKTFCYVCGDYQPLSYCKKISDAVIQAYKYCFGLNMKNLDENWVPQSICRNCHKMLIDCYNDDLSKLKYSTPTLWNKAESREDCFFCMTDAIFQFENSFENQIFSNKQSFLLK